MGWNEVTDCCFDVPPITALAWIILRHRVHLVIGSGWYKRGELQALGPSILYIVSYIGRSKCSNEFWVLTEYTCYRRAILHRATWGRNGGRLWRRCSVGLQRRRRANSCHSVDQKEPSTTTTSVVFCTTSWHRIRWRWAPDNWRKIQGHRRRYGCSEYKQQKLIVPGNPQRGTGRWGRLRLCGGERRGQDHCNGSRHRSWWLFLSSIDTENASLRYEAVSTIRTYSRIITDFYCWALCWTLMCYQYIRIK